MKHKNLLKVFAILLLIAVAFTACGDSDSDGDMITLRWMMGSLSPNQPDSTMVWDAVNEELQNHLPGIQLEITAVPFGEYQERWMLEAAAGGEFDIAWFGWMLNLANEVNMGSIMPLTDLVERYGQNIRQELPEFLFTNNTLQDELWLISSNQLAARPQVGFFTPTALAERHLDIPAFERAAQEWADSDRMYAPPALMDVIENYIQNVYDAGELGMGIRPISGWLSRHYWFTIDHTKVAFTRPHDYTSQVHSILDPDFVEEQIEFYSRWQDWRERGFIRVDAITRSEADWDNGFYRFPDGDGYLFFAQNYTRDSGTQRTNQFGFDVTGLPLLYPMAPIHPNPANTAQSIMAGASNPEAAMQFLDFLFSAEGTHVYNMLSFGLEGTHWNFVDEASGIIELTDASENYDLLPAWALGNTYYAFTTPGGDPDYHRYMTRVYNHSARSLPLQGFVFDSINLVAESTALHTIFEEYAGQLVTGMTEDARATIEERNRRLEAAGVRNFATEFERQIAEWQANR